MVMSIFLHELLTSHIKAGFITCTFVHYLLHLLCVDAVSLCSSPDEQTFARWGT